LGGFATLLNREYVLRTLSVEILGRALITLCRAQEGRSAPILLGERFFMCVCVCVSPVNLMGVERVRCYGPGYICARVAARRDRRPRFWTFFFGMLTDYFGPNLVQAMTLTLGAKFKSHYQILGTIVGLPSAAPAGPGRRQPARLGVGGFCFCHRCVPVWFSHTKTTCRGTVHAVALFTSPGTFGYRFGGLFEFMDGRKAHQQLQL
jgi:hypothetical protein